jgi:hypothetical protein
MNGLNRPWVGSKLPYDEANIAIFQVSTKITTGHGNMALLWQDNLIGLDVSTTSRAEFYKIIS